MHFAVCTPFQLWFPKKNKGRKKEFWDLKHYCLELISPMVWTCDTRLLYTRQQVSKKMGTDYEAINLVLMINHTGSLFFSSPSVTVIVMVTSKWENQLSSEYKRWAEQLTSAVGRQKAWQITNLWSKSYLAQVPGHEASKAIQWCSTGPRSLRNTPIS